MKSLLKVIDIIEAVAENGNVGIRKLSALTGFPPSTIHRIVSTLVERKYFKQDPITRTYSLSFRFLELGTRVQQQFNIASLARPHLERLMSKTKESVNIAVRDGDSVIYLDHVRSTHAMLQLFTRPGARVSLYATGVGKMFMSRFGQEELDAYLKRTLRIKYTPRTLIERDEIIEELNHIREQGFAVDNEEMEEGVRCVAALVFNHDGEPSTAISLSGAAIRIIPEKFEYYGEEIRRCVQDISRELGFKGAKGPGSFRE